MKTSRRTTKSAEVQPEASSPPGRKTRWWTYAVGLLCVAAAWPLYQYNISHLRKPTGLAKMEAGDFTGAIGELEREESFYPNRPETVYWLAVAHRRAGHFRVFREYLERAQELGYPDGEIQRQLLLMRIQSGEVDPELETQADELIQRAATFTGASADAFVDEFYEARAQGHLVNYRLFDARIVLDHWVQAKPESIPARLMLVDILQRSMNFQAAERECREVLVRDPGNITARLQHARVLTINKKVQEAEAEYRLCLETAPQEFRAQIGLAECELRSGKRDESARERLLAALKQDLAPRQRAQALCLLGEIARSNKENEQAIKYLTEGLSLATPPDSTAYNMLSAAYAAVDKREEAAKYLKLSREKGERDSRLLLVGSQIIAMPENAMLRFEQGNIYLEEGKLDEAAGWWNMAVRFDPNLQPAHEALAKYYTQKGDRERADYHRQMAEQATGTTFNKLWLALLDSNIKTVRDGLPQLARYPSMREAVELLTVGLNVVERKELEHSIEVLNRLVHNSHLRLRVLTMRAEALYLTGHFKAAERDYQEVLSLSSRNIVAHRGLQAIYFDMGDYGRMEHHALQVAEIDPTDYRPHRHLGFLRREAENWEAAILDYKESLRRSPHQPSLEEVLLEMADCYIHALKHQDALDLLADARPSVQKSFLEAQCKYATKKASEAKKLLDESLKLSPDHSPSLLLRADIALSDADVPAARGYLERAVRAAPFDNNALQKLSTVLLRLGEKEAAKKAGERAKELLDLNVRFSELNGQVSQRPTDIDIRLELASLARQLGREEDAKRWKRVADALAEDAKSVVAEPPLPAKSPGSEGFPDIDVRNPVRQGGPPIKIDLNQPVPAPQIGPNLNREK